MFRQRYTHVNGASSPFPMGARDCLADRLASEFISSPTVPASPTGLPMPHFIVGESIKTWLGGHGYSMRSRTEGQPDEALPGEARPTVLAPL